MPSSTTEVHDPPFFPNIRFWALLRFPCHPTCHGAQTVPGPGVISTSSHLISKVSAGGKKGKNHVQWCFAPKCSETSLYSINPHSASLAAVQTAPRGCEWKGHVGLFQGSMPQYTRSWCWLRIHHNRLLLVSTNETRALKGCCVKLLMHCGCRFKHPIFHTNLPLSYLLEVPLLSPF